MTVVCVMILQLHTAFSNHLCALRGSCTFIVTEPSALLDHPITSHVYWRIDALGFSIEPWVLICIEDGGRSRWQGSHVVCQRPRLKIAGSQDASRLMLGSSRPVVEAVSTELTLRRQRRKSQMLKPRFKPRVTVRLSCMMIPASSMNHRRNVSQKVINLKKK